MMRKLILSAVGIGTAMMLAAQVADDPTVMVIDGTDVKLSEFEYLYNKNSSQQLEPVTFDQYVDMFVNYKLKVVEALDNKMDTTQAFVTEFERFRADLAKPYLRDNTVEQELIDEAYGHTKQDVYVSHIMLDVRQPNGLEFLDSLRNEILNGNTTFEDAAFTYSVDRGSSRNGGRMGWLAGTGRVPWNFEKAAYDTPVGQLSEVINSGVGYHIVRPDSVRPDRGEVKVRHILVLTRGLDPEEEAAKKATIDSLYQVVIAPNADFAEIAEKYSEDPGSAKDGGLIDWFGSGMMVPQFENVAFSLADGEISEPFATAYGYHIVLKLGHRDSPDLEQIRPRIERLMQQDQRAMMPVQAKLDQIAAETGSKRYTDYRDVVREIIAKNNGVCDSIAIDQILTCEIPAFIANGKTVKVSDLANKIVINPDMEPNAALAAVDRAVVQAYNRELTEYGISVLYQTEPEYRNLVNEYRDGILLFDISNQNVWDYAAKDSKGLEKFFEKNRKQYSTWTEPRFKSYVIFSANDSIEALVKEYVGTLDSKLSQEDFTASLKDRFGKDVKVERVVAAKGDNPITDYLGFGGDRPDTENKRWTTFFAWQDKLIDQPEEVIDVKAQVLTDYQSHLEKEWVKKLRKKHKVKINRDILETARN